jgi:predicted MFS family arabinose efflux permease
MSAKSAIKQLVPENAESSLFKWVALLTGSKNTLKGVGFFMGGALLVWLGFQGAVTAMAAVLLLVWISSLLLLKKELGKASYKPKFREIFSKSDSVNRLSAARFFLFGARDIWFVIALPVFLAETLNWGEEATGAFMAMWIIGYGIIQASSPKLLNNREHPPSRDRAVTLAALLTIVPTAIAALLFAEVEPSWVIMVGLALFALIFALNSAVHSYLIVSYAKADGVSLDVGFYYMANAMGRLIGTLLSGALFQWAGLGIAGLVACLVGSAIMVLAAALLSRKLPV